MLRSDIVVERVGDYSIEVAAGIGALMPYLSSRLNADPIPKDLLKPIIESSESEQFVARYVGIIVGAATLNTILSPNDNLAYLTDFVVSDHPKFRGKGVGYALWQEMGAWCRERQLTSVEWTSGWRRQEAHQFYLRQGAKIRDDTAHFIYEIPEVSPDA